jgi:hypothetical protein
MAVYHLLDILLAGLCHCHHQNKNTKNTKNTTFRNKLLPSSGPTVRKKLLPKRCVFSVFILVVTMEKVLKEVRAVSESQFC